MLSLVIAVVLLGVGCLSAHAATFYVSTAGADSVTCAQAQSAQTPRRTINQGIACLSSGDTLLIGSGHYHEFLTTYSGVGAAPIPNGSAAAYTTLKAQQTGQVTLTFTPFGDFWSPIELGNDSHHIQIEGLVLDGQQFAIPGGIGLGENSSYHRFKDILIHHVEGMGVNGTGSNHEFLNVSMHHIAYTESGQTTCHHKTCSNPPGQLCPGYCHPYYLFGTGHLIDGGTYEHVDGWVFHWYATNSIIRNASVRNATVGAGLIGSGNVLYNNIFADTAVGVFMTSGQTVVHNTIHRSTRDLGGEKYGIYQQSGSPNVIKNNLILQEDRSYIYIDGGGGATGNYLSDVGPHANVAGNLCDASTAGCASAPASPSPVVNASAMDFRLRAGSPAIGAGVNLPDVAMRIDKDGVARPPTGTVDSGAYQYVSGGPRPPAPLNLRVQVP